MIVSFDVETTGIPYWSRPKDAPEQPRMIQIGAVLCDREWREISTMRLLVQPDGWVIGEEVLGIHGISTETCLQFGLPIKAVLIPFIEMVKRASIAIAYNFGFDSWFIESELLRLGSDDLGMKRPGLRIIDPHKIGAALSDDGKWMKLRNLHRALLGWDYPDAHDGLHDTRATLRCARAMVDRKMIEL